MFEGWKVETTPLPVVMESVCRPMKIKELSALPPRTGVRKCMKGKELKQAHRPREIVQGGLRGTR